MTKARVAILISGTGSNMAALIYASRATSCPYEVVLVTGDKPDAPGLTLAEAALPRFQAAIEGVAAEAGVAALLQPAIDSDGSLPADALDIAHAIALRDGGAWGQGYPEPAFDDEFSLLDFKPVGERHLGLRVQREGRTLTAMHFGGWDGTPPSARMRLVYRLTPDDWRGGEAIQLIVLHRAPA